MPVDFRAIIRRAMKVRNISQGELARRTGTSRQAINRYIVGRCGISDKVLAKAFDALGVPVGNAEPNPTKGTP